MVLDAETKGINAEMEVIRVYSAKGLDESGVEEEKWFVEGYAATADYDRQNDIITPEAMAAAVEAIKTKSNTVLDNHDSNKRLGVIVDAMAKAAGLWVKVLISKTVPEKWKQIQEGVLNKFSIWADWVREKKYNAELQKEVNYITKFEPYEVSMVSVPANPNARALAWYVSKAYEGKEFFKKELEEVEMSKELVEKVKKSLGVEKDEEIEGAIEGLKALKEKEAKVVEAEAKVKALESRLDTTQKELDRMTGEANAAVKELNENKGKAFVEDAVKKSIIHKDTEAYWLKEYIEEPKKTEERMANMRPGIDLSRKSGVDQSTEEEGKEFSKEDIASGKARLALAKKYMEAHKECKSLEAAMSAVGPELEKLKS